LEFNLVNVGIADLKIASDKDILRTILGSCIGICLYDSASRIGGLSHIMLPVMRTENSSKKKYADTAIPMLAEEMKRAGADLRRVTAKIVGGSTMFNLSERSVMTEIGKNNIVKVKEVLKGMEIEIIAEDTGGDYGRTIDFYLENGSVKIKSLGKQERII
jgi:chemotaxis protein CheD